MIKVENDAGVFYAREGYYNGQKVIVTHRDQANGMVWLENYAERHKGSPVEYGKWVNGDSVTYKEEKFNRRDFKTAGGKSGNSRKYRKSVQTGTV